jgi:hypothetical protein
MITPEITQTANRFLTRNAVRAYWYYLRGWRGVLLLAAIALAIGLAANWSWLIAAGIAPAILSGLPCLVMCGAGLCMNKLVGGVGRPCDHSQLDQSATDLREKEKDR